MIKGRLLVASDTTSRPPCFSYCLFSPTPASPSTHPYPAAFLDAHKTSLGSTADTAHENRTSRE